MTEVIVHAGSCGFKTTVVVSKEAQRFRIAVSSDCEAVRDWGDHLQPLSPGEIFNPQKALQFYESALVRLRHVACPVPLTVIKAMEVEAGAALPRDVRIVFENLEEEAQDGLRGEEKGNS